mgnify:CR=1 FL=1
MKSKLETMGEKTQRELTQGELTQVELTQREAQELQQLETDSQQANGFMNMFYKYSRYAKVIQEYKVQELMEKYGLKKSSLYELTKDGVLRIKNKN